MIIIRAQLLNKLLDKKNKRLNRIIAQAAFDSLYISENNLTTDQVTRAMCFQK